MPRQFLLPDLGEGIHEAQIVRVLIKPGERVAEDQSLMEVETDKAAVEIPSPFAGIAQTVHVSEGQTVSVGAVIVTFDDGAAATASATPSAKAPAPSPTKSAPASAGAPKIAAPTTAGPAPSNRTAAAAAPYVRKLAREMGIDIDSVRGSGPGGRVTQEDLEQHGSSKSGQAGASAQTASGSRATSDTVPATKSRPQAAGPLPGVKDVDKWGPIRREPLTQIRKTIANQMSRSAYTAVHVTHGDEADITSLDRLRRELNEVTNNDPKLTIMAFVIRATCLALKRHPSFNASFDAEGGQVVYKDYINMGVAVDTERGLIVPVIRNADQLSLRGISQELRSIADRVRSTRFDIEDLRGGTFTITNVGALGGTFSTPIINFPEVAILGLGRSRKVPIVRDDKIEIALTLPLNLSFDHRATDGANAARFCGEILGYLEHPGKFMLD